jgi:hypothetical protein
MGTKPITTPRQFYVECPQCGTYRTTNETVRRFITPKLREVLDNQWHQGAVGAKLKFSGGCPKCQPNSTHEIELIALKPPKQRLH